MVDAAASSTHDDAEALRILTGLSRGRFGRIAPERIARHVIQSQLDADWAVRRAAFDALVRRYSFAQRDGLLVAERPGQGVLGSYRTSGQAGGRTRPYETALYRIEPLVTSCACADFVRSSLGLCKHGLVVLELLEQRQLLGPAAVSGELSPELRWSYFQPASGPFDRLARLRLDPQHGLGWGGGHPDLHERLPFIERLERAIASGELRAEPAVATLLAEERARAVQQSALIPHVAAAVASLPELKRTLYPYQDEGLQHFLQRGRLLLADDMGLGKTTQAVAACHALHRGGAIARALLIVPTPLKSQWLREWQNTSDVPVQLVEGSPKERKQLYRTTATGALVIGYEQLLRDLEHVQAFAPELVVLDEAQRIKNWATKSAAYVKSLAPPYRLVLTGTPLENRFDELASIMDFVDDLALEPKWRLLPFHSVAGDEREAAGARHLHVLRARLATAMLRRTRGDVLDQLPSRTDTRVPVEMSDVQRTRHDELRQPIAELSARAEQRALARGELMRLMQLLTMQRMICNGMAQVEFDEAFARCQDETPTPALLESLFAPKLSVLRGLIEQLVLAQKRKVVVFSQWRKFLRLGAWAVSDVLAGEGLRSLFFTGAESGAARERALLAFNDDPSAAVLFASDAGAVGLNLQRAASCCINLELPWNPALLEQRIGRIHRLGQTQPVDVYNLVTEEGIEGRIASLLEQKQALFSAVFDGSSDAVAFSGRRGLLASVKQLVDPWPVSLSSAPEASGDLDPGAQLLEESAPVVSKERAGRTAPATATLLAELGVQVTQLPDGGLRIEAPAQHAKRLSAMLARFATKAREAE